MTITSILYCLAGSFAIALFVGCALGRVSAKHRTTDEDRHDYVEAVASYRTRAIIAEVRRQQRMALSWNRHLIVGQQVRRRGELVWPWERDEGQGDA